MKKLIAIMVLAVYTGQILSQDISYYNPNQSLLTLNPSFAGTNGFLRNQLSYRNQYPNLSHGFVDYMNTFDGFIAPINAGVGISASMSNDWIYRNSGIALTYAQHLSYKGIKIIPSLQISYHSAAVDLSSLRFGDPLIPRYGHFLPAGMSHPVTPVSTKKYADFTGGLLISAGRYYLGGSLAHMSRPDIGHAGPFQLPSILNLHASSTYTLGGAHLLQVMATYRSGDRYSDVFHLGVNGIWWNHLIAGLGWRSGDNLQGNLGFRGDLFSVVLGYDMTYSRLAGNTAGSWEMHASFNLRKRELRGTLTPFEEM